jgi:hypothetical protein
MISSLVHMSLSSGVFLLASWLLEEVMVVLDMAEEMVVLEHILEMMMPLPLPLMSEEFVVLERISEMMSLPLPLPLMSEEFVVLVQISEMMMPLPLPLMPRSLCPVVVIIVNSLLHNHHVVVIVTASMFSTHCVLDRCSIWILGLLVLG